MTPFFPRDTVEWRSHEPAAIRRLTLSLVAMALLAGVLFRLYRLAVLMYAPPENLWVFLAAMGGGMLIVLGLATLHLGNFPVRHWLWRAPLFGASEAAAAVLTGAVLVAIGADRMGTGQMSWGDWRGTALATLALHTGVVCMFALILAGVVQAVRRILLRREHREHTLDAIHEEHVRHP
ncbi:MAG: hypothetical protein M3373_11120 [Gemmatimonadota bacterium]|nr:hypothetical protein [Gemmatimonadota bacterium]